MNKKATPAPAAYDVGQEELTMNIYGIDVSKYQSVVDWQKVKAAGKDFVFVRLGWCGYDGKIAANKGLDPLFETNVKGAAAAGLHVGVYVYSYAKTPEAAAIAARETLELVKPYKLTYPIAFDIEDAVNLQMTKAENGAIVKAFLNIIEQAGYYGLLYTYKSFAQANLDMTDLAAYDVWIAQYAAANTYDGKYGIWQYAGETGRCDGVATACDLNVAYKDYAAIIAAAGLNNPEPDNTGNALEEANARIAALEDAILRIKLMLEELLKK